MPGMSPLGRSATFKSEHERFDRRWSQFDPEQTLGLLRSRRSTHGTQTPNVIKWRCAVKEASHGNSSTALRRSVLISLGGGVPDLGSLPLERYAPTEIFAV